MASAVQICNLALLKFGNKTINALSEQTPEAIACNVYYPLMRDELQYAHPWNFVMTRVDLGAALSETPAFQWDYQYQLPTNCLRIIEFFGVDAEWVREGDKFLTNESENIYIRYIQQVTNTGNFNPAYVNCLATRLAAELVAKIKQDKRQRQDLLTELEQVLLPGAYRLNAIEGNKPRHKDEQPLDNGNYAWQSDGR